MMSLMDPLIKPDCKQFNETVNKTQIAGSTFPLCFTQLHHARPSVRQFIKSLPSSLKQKKNPQRKKNFEYQKLTLI
jgi:hypothetical protein